MAGFGNIKQWADATTDDGAYWISAFRKVPASVTVAGQWFDWSGTSGVPIPNYFASTPLVAETLNFRNGIYHGENVAPKKKFIHRLTTMMGGSSATATTMRDQPLILCDYLLYYPFIDMDTVGEDQTLDNTNTITRYTDGKGVRAMLIAQTPTVSGGQFTVTYTNQAGVSGRVTPTHFCSAANPIGALVSATTAAAGVHPFLTLQDGDTGMRSVESINFSVANGGLAVLVLCFPLVTQFIAEECRRNTSVGAQEGFGGISELEAVRTRPAPVQIQDEAFLAAITQTNAGTVQNSQLVGLLETVWR